MTALQATQQFAQRLVTALRAAVLPFAPACPVATIGAFTAALAVNGADTSDDLEGCAVPLNRCGG